MTSSAARQWSEASTTQQQFAAIRPGATNIGMHVRNTRRHQDVLAVYRWSLAQCELGLVEQLPDWDATPPWRNALFREASTGQQWVAYLADRAWPGEVRLAASALAAT